MEIESQPEELDKIERKLLQLKIEQQALSKEDDDSSKARLEKINAEYADLKNTRDAMHLRWENERSAIESIRDKKAKLEELRTQESIAERNGDFAKAAEIVHGMIPQLQREIEEESAHLTEARTSSFAKRSTRTISPASSPPGQEFPLPRCRARRCRST